MSSSNSEFFRSLGDKIDQVLNDLSSEYITDLNSEACKGLLGTLAGPYKEGKRLDPEAFTKIGQGSSPICFDANVIAQSMLHDSGAKELDKDPELVLLHLLPLALHEHRHHFQEISEDFKTQPEIVPTKVIDELEENAQTFAFVVISLSIGSDSVEPTYIYDQPATEIIEKYKHVHWNFIGVQEKKQIFADASNAIAKLMVQLDDELKRAQEAKSKIEDTMHLAWIVAGVLGILVLLVSAGIIVLPQLLLAPLIFSSVGIFFGAEPWRDHQVEKVYSEANKMKSLILKIQEISVTAAGDNNVRP